MKNVQNIGLLIADEVQLVGGEVGPTYEVIISCTRYVSAQTEIKTRIVACGVSLANARDLGEWMGAPSHAIFNFSPRYVEELDLYVSSNTICSAHLWIWISTCSHSRFRTSGSGKTICAEFALLRLWSKQGQPRAVCIEPYQEMVNAQVKEWRAKFEKLQGGKEIVSLTGETSVDLRLLEKGDIIVCTPTQVRIQNPQFIDKSVTNLRSGMSCPGGGVNERMSRTLAF